MTSLQLLERISCLLTSMIEFLLPQQSDLFVLPWPEVSVQMY